MAQHVSPRDKFESKLQQLWMEVLAAPTMSVQDDFFELGGDSIQGAELCSRIEEAFGVSFCQSIIFEARTIEAQASILFRGQRRTGRELTSVVCIQNHGSHPPIFFLHVHDGMAAYCTKFTKYLGADQPIYSVHSQALAGELPHLSVEDMARHYVQELRSLQPVGPYHLFGYCAGGRLAFEMAQQLAHQGQRVALLAMLDSPAPGSSTLGFFGPLSALPKKLKYELLELRKLSFTAMPSYFLARLAVFSHRCWLAVRKKTLRATAGVLRWCGIGPQTWVDVPIEEINAAASRKYRPTKPFAGRIVFFHTPQLEFLYSTDPVSGWAPLASSGVEVIYLPDGEAATPNEEQARAIAVHLRSLVDSGTADRNAVRV